MRESLRVYVCVRAHLLVLLQRHDGALVSASLVREANLAQQPCRPVLFLRWSDLNYVLRATGGEGRGKECSGRVYVARDS